MSSYGTQPHEVRLALVLNGGVSLAVWMGGVTHEIDLLRLATAPEPGPEPGPESGDDGTPSAAFAYWRELCAELKVSLVVDIVAGTSAGGLNGTLLASAVAAGRPLPQDLRRLWIEEAALTGDKLLSPQTPPESLLNGDFFEAQIDRVTRDVGDRTPNGTAVTLFVTATGLGGQQSVGTDSFGGEFAFDDHRRLYRFAYNPGRYRFGGPGQLEPDPENDFDHDGRAALVRAARASASFPVAFAPVVEDPLVAEDRTGRRYRVTPDALAAVQPPTALMDGGVLDNAPFAPVIEEIGRRPVNGPYRRILGYVVPSSGLPDACPQPVPDADADARPPTPRWTDVLVRALNAPREVDFRDDIDRMDTAFAKASESSLRRLYLRLRHDEGGARAPLQATAAGVLGEYRRARAAGGVWHARRVLSRRPLRVSLASPRPVDVDAVLRTAGCRWLPPADATLDPPKADSWPWGVSVAEHVVLMMLRDVQDQLNAPQQSAVAATAAPFAGAGVLARSLSAAMAQIHAVEEALYRELVARGTGRCAAPETLSDAALAGLLDDIFADLKLSETLYGVVSRAAREYAAAAGYADQQRGTADVMTYALAAEVLSRSFADPTLGKLPPPMEFVRIGPDINSPHPDLSAYDVDGDRKLFGTKVGHFGAFAVDRARAHDWLWGRLDAAAHLTRLLMPASASRADVRDRVLRAQRAVLDDEAGRSDVGSGTDLAVRLAAERPLVTSSDGVLVRKFLDTTEGRTTAVEVGRSITHLLTCGTPDETRKGWQLLVEAVVAEKQPARAGLLNPLVRWLTRRLRGELWRSLRTQPVRLVPRLAAAARWWAASQVLMAALFGVVVGAVVVPLFYGDARTAGAAAAVAGAWMAALVLRIWVLRERLWWIAPVVSVATVALLAVAWA